MDTAIWWRPLGCHQIKLGFKSPRRADFKQFSLLAFRKLPSASKILRTAKRELRIHTIIIIKQLLDAQTLCPQDNHTGRGFKLPGSNSSRSDVAPAASQAFRGDD